MRFDTIRLEGSDAPIELRKESLDPSAKFFLKDISGLEPPPVDVSVFPTVNATGIYEGSRPQTREIVIKIGLRPNWRIGETPDDLRALLYSLYPNGNGDPSYLKLRTTSPANTVAQAAVYPKNITPVYMTKDPEVQLVLACLDSYLQDNSATMLTEHPGTHILLDVPETETAPVGFRMGVQFTADVSNFKLTSNSDPTKFILVNRAFNSTDKLIIDTRQGLKKIERTQDSIVPIVRNNLGFLSDDSTWLWIEKGSTGFYTNTLFFNWLPSECYYVKRYWGV